MKDIAKIREYIKNNKCYILVMIIGFIAYCIQTKYVVLYADDMTLGVIAKGSMADAFRHLAKNYMDWGGGPTPLIAIMFMEFSPKVWKIFNCIIMFFTVLISVKMISNKTKSNKGITACLIWSFIFTLNIWTSRETIYWMDGHLAYVLTMFQLLLYFYYLHSRLILNTPIKKYDYILLPLVAFFSGCTGPQPAVLTVLVGIILVIWKKVINKEKIPTLLKIAIAFSVLGFLVEVLAPGNNIRMIRSFPEFAEYGLLEKIEYRVDMVYGLIFNFYEYGLGSLAFFAYIAFGLIAGISYRVASKEKNQKLKIALKVSSAIIIGFITIVTLARLGLVSQEFSKLVGFYNLFEMQKRGTFEAEMLIPYIIATFIMVIVFLQVIYIGLKRKNEVLIVTFTCALIAQGIMIMAPYSPLRSTFFSIVLLWMSIANLIKIAYEEKIDINYIIVLVLATMQKELRIIWNNCILCCI